MLLLPWNRLSCWLSVTVLQDEERSGKYNPVQENQRRYILVLAAFLAEYMCGYLRKQAVWLPVTLLKGVTRSIRRASEKWPKRGKWWYKDFKYVQLEFSGHRFEFESDLNNIVTKQLLKTGTGGSMSTMQKLIAWRITKRWLNFLKIG